MLIQHIKREVNGVVSESILIDEVLQTGYKTPVLLGEISLETANILLKELSAKLSEIPY